MSPLSRRQFLQCGGALGVAAAPVALRGPERSELPPASDNLDAPVAEHRPGRSTTAAVRPRRGRDDGKPLLRQLPGCAPPFGQARARGLTFNRSGGAGERQPRARRAVPSFPFGSTAQGPDVTQTWNATHRRSTAGGWTAS